MTHDDDPYLVAPTDLAVMAPAIASLPRWFREGGNDAGILIVDGGERWVDRVDAALAEQRTAIILMRPGWAEPDAARRLALRAAEAAIPVIIDYPRASNPAVAAAAGEWSRMITATGLLEATSLRSAETEMFADLLDGFAMVRALAGPVDDILTLSCESEVYSAVVTVSIGAGRLTVTLVGAVGDAAASGTRVRVRWLGPDGALELDVVEDGTARPAHSRVVTATGETLAATRYEDSHRATLLRLAAQLRAGGGSCDDLGLLADDLAQLAAHRS